jgi:hypothetical protein
MRVPEALRCAPAVAKHSRVRNVLAGVDRSSSSAAYYERDGVPIIAFVGANGSGKTWFAVLTVSRTLLYGQRWQCEEPSHAHMHVGPCAGARYLDRCVCGLSGPTEGERYVWSNLPLLDPETGEPHWRYRPIRTYRDLAMVEHADVLLDEATAVADAQEHASLPQPVRNVLAQQRKRDVRLVWTAVDFANANKRIRQATQGVAYCSGGAKERTASASGQQWQASRRLRATLWDAKDFDAFSASDRMDARPLSRQMVWRPGHIVDRMYDTRRYVDLIGASNDAGVCMGCGGRRQAPKCSCPHDPSSVPDGVVEEQDARGTRHRRVEA